MTQAISGNMNIFILYSPGQGVIPTGQSFPHPPQLYTGVQENILYTVQGLHTHGPHSSLSSYNPLQYILSSFLPQPLLCPMSYLLLLPTLLFGIPSPISLGDPSPISPIIGFGAVQFTFFLSCPCSPGFYSFHFNFVLLSPLVPSLNCLYL